MPRILVDGREYDAPLIREMEDELSRLRNDIAQSKRHEEMLRDSARRKDDFLALLGHELRNPLAPIRNACQILELLDVQDPRAERARSIIARQASHLTRIVDDLLDVARIASGRMALDRKPVDWAGVVRSATEDYLPGFESRGVELHVEPCPKPIAVLGDATRLAQIIGNLLGNAQKFTRSGDRVVVRLLGDERRRWSTLIVQDTGVGMAPQMLARVFLPFEQGDPEVVRSASGFGLGLSLVKGLVEIHGGTVEARSAGPGQGSEFLVHLPITEERPVSMAAAESLAVPPTRVLLIEDNRDTAESLRDLLAMAGCDVDIAFDGPSGLERARAKRPSTVLCNIGLPGKLDGYAVARALRSDPIFGSTQLVAVTGYAQEEDRCRALAAGFDSHVTKPTDPGELLRIATRRRELQVS